MSRLLVLCLTFAGVVPARAQQTPPPLFQKLDFEAALARATGAGRVFVLDAMTSWCSPCKQMDATTWRDPLVTQWFDANGLAIQLDMDHHGALKNQLAIKAFPTIVAFKNGVEFDRIIGTRGAKEFVAWLDGVKSGKTAAQALLEQLARARAAGDAAWDERAAIADELVSGKEFDEATREYVWLWTHAADEERVLSLVFGMRDLVRQHFRAASPFNVLRWSLGERIGANSATAGEQRRWIELNTVLGDERATADWADRLALATAGIAELRALEARLFDLLIENGRWRTAGLALVDPVTELRREGSQLGAYDLDAPAPGGPTSIPAIPLGGPAKAPEPESERALPAIPMAVPASSRGAAASERPQPQTPDEIAREVRARLTWQFRSRASARYAALLTAGRNAEATAVADVLLQAADDPRSRAALVAAARRAGVLDAAREAHQRWLDEAAN